MVTIVGIGDYENELANLKDAVRKDYKNAIEAFAKTYDYMLFYRTEANSTEYATHSTRNGYYSLPFKLYWTEKEIREFNNEIKETIIKNGHDSLIYIISGHGDSFDQIYDSEEAEIQLISIFDEFWSKSFPYLSQKPKIFIVDACRGGKVPSLFKKKARSGSNKLRHKKHANAKLLINEQNCRYIFGNPAGYAVIDGGRKGGYLLRAFRRILCNKARIFKYKWNLDEIIQRVRTQVNYLVGENSMQLIEDTNVMEYDIYFRERKNKGVRESNKSNSNVIDNYNYNNSNNIVSIKYNIVAENNIQEPILEELGGDVGNMNMQKNGPNLNYNHVNSVDALDNNTIEKGNTFDILESNGIIEMETNNNGKENEKNDDENNIEAVGSPKELNEVPTIVDESDADAPNHTSASDGDDELPELPSDLPTQQQ